MGTGAAGRTRCLAVIAVALATSAGIASAGGLPPDPVLFEDEFVVNTTLSFNWQITAERGPEGDFVVVWQSYEGYSIRGQALAADGTFLGAEFQANSSGAYNSDPDAAKLDAGDFVVIWTEFYTGLYGQRFDRSGTSLGENFLVFPEFQRSSAVASNGTDFLVAWYKVPSLHGQRYAADGTAVGEPISFEISNVGYFLDVGMTPDGDFAMVWAHDGVFAQRFDSAGTAVGTMLELDSDATNGVRDTDIAMAPDGGFLVVWERGDFGIPDNGVFGRMVSPAGVPIAEELQIDPGVAGAPDAAVGLDGSFVVVWRKGRKLPPPSPQIYGRKLTSDGELIGHEFQISPGTVVHDGDPAVALTTSEDYLVVWGREDADPDPLFLVDVIGRFFRPPPSGIEIPTLDVYGLLAVALTLGVLAVALIQRRL